MIIIVSAKKRKIAIYEKFTLDNLKKICEIEKISSAGTKDDIVKRLARISLKKARRYSKNIGLIEDFSIFDHSLVPKHKIMNKKEKEKLLKKYSITLNNLPRIRVRDPAAMAIGAKVGDVIEITRKSPTAKESKYYRVVVKRPVKR